MSLNDFIRVDDQDFVLAEDPNRVTPSTLRGELGEALAITSELVLTDGDFPYLKVTPNANLDVLLPPEATTNHLHVIRNGSGTYTLTIKDDSDTNVIEVLGPLTVGMFIPSLGSGWDVIKAVSNSAAADRVHTIMDGLRLTWNSAASINVDVGACYAENGDWIDVTSAITKSALSLSASTWYHVYVYLSSGTPAAEVVTTAPVAWKGTAYSKTGDTSRRYVGSIRSDGSGNVYEFMHNPLTSHILYSGDTDTNMSPFAVVSGGTATTATSVDCTAVIPVTSRIGQIRMSNTGNQLCDFGTNSNVKNARVPAVNVAIAQHPLTAGQLLYYKYVSAPSSGALYCNVYGYYFER